MLEWIMRFIKETSACVRVFRDDHHGYPHEIRCERYVPLHKDMGY